VTFIRFRSPTPLPVLGVVAGMLGLAILADGAVAVAGPAPRPGVVWSRGGDPFFTRAGWYSNQAW